MLKEGSDDQSQWVDEVRMIERAFEDSFVSVRGLEFEEDDIWQRPQGSDAWNLYAPHKGFCQVSWDPASVTKIVTKKDNFLKLCPEGQLGARVSNEKLLLS